jgi:hypothetical protein
MAIFVASDFSVTVNGTALSSYLTQVELKTSANDITTTSFGNTWVTRVAGLKEGTVTLAFNQDYATTGPDALLWSTIGLGSQATVVIKPTATAVSATNPAYTAVAVVTDLTPVSGTIGDLSVFTVTWPTTGPVSRATA